MPQRARGWTAAFVVLALAGCRLSPQRKEAAMRTATTALLRSVFAIESSEPTSQSKREPVQTEITASHDAVDSDSSAASNVAVETLPVHLLPLSDGALNPVSFSTEAPAELVAFKVSSLPELDLNSDVPTVSVASNRVFEFRSTRDIDVLQKAVDRRLAVSACPTDQEIARRISVALKGARLELEMQKVQTLSRRRIVVVASSCVARQVAEVLQTVSAATVRFD